MKDFINIGSVPVNEDCAQCGVDPDYTEKAKKECRAFIHQLRREFGKEPVGAKLKVKGFLHEFGTYLEIVCYYDDTIEEATDYAYSCEAKMPIAWDNEARQELGL